MAHRATHIKWLTVGRLHGASERVSPSDTFRKTGTCRTGTERILESACASDGLNGIFSWTGIHTVYTGTGPWHPVFAFWLEPFAGLHSFRGAD